MKIILREIQKTDRLKLAEFANNKKIWLNLRDMMPFPYTLQDADNFIAMSQDREGKYRQAITFEGEFCGLIGIHFLSDVNRLSAEIGYWIGEPYWGKGIATKAISLMVDYGFENYDLVRIFASVFENNMASARVLEKNGFIYEGTGKKAVVKDGIIMDEHRYAITK